MKFDKRDDDIWIAFVKERMREEEMKKAYDEMDEINQNE